MFEDAEEQLNRAWEASGYVRGQTSPQQASELGTGALVVMAAIWLLFEYSHKKLR